MWRVAAVSLVVLIPCFWQSRIQAGDLSSHIYNAWLAQWIERGEAPGLELTHPWTNVLFDTILSTLLRAVGADAAQRIAVSGAVLIFVWGAFFFIATVSRRRPWFLMPWIAMLAYGWVFHMGFFNFYLSLGLCWWALGCICREDRFAWLAIPIFAIAVTAHILPVLWAVAMALYFLAARRVGPLAIGLASLLAIAGARVLLDRIFITRCNPGQAVWVSGADQLFVFGPTFLIAASLLLGVWVLAAQRLGWKQIFSTLPLQFAALTAAGIAILPNAVSRGPAEAALTYLPERMSLAVGILICAALARWEPVRFERFATVALAAGFFTMLHFETRRLNRMEDEVTRIVRQLPPMQPVIGATMDARSRIAFLHFVDRACIGTCFSFANYEPCSRMFRIRVRSRNPMVVDSYAASFAMQTGTFAPSPDDPPRYQIATCGEGLCLNLLLPRCPHE
ncbi:MAG: hypothetical protein LAO79_14800 [Acidobacteriia bacterium]|nr:hypothetical protein [Terriglobia bacterium]